MNPLRYTWLVAVLCLSPFCFTATEKCNGQNSPQAIEILTCESKALSARVALINAATTEIVVSTFYIEPGQSTDVILDALRAAAARGVRVRLLLDGLKMELTSGQIQSLTNVGVCVREFHPTGSGNLLKLNRRLHSKLFVVDETYLILGSRNLRDKHFGLANKNFIDFEVVMQGDVALQAVRYFNWVWNSCHVDAANGRDEKFENCNEDSITKCPEFAFEFSPQFVAPVCCLHDRKIDKAARVMQAKRVSWVNSARDSLTIETPYAVFSRDSLLAIEAASKRGVRVRLFTNSGASTDMPITYAALQNTRRRLLKSGVEIYEYQGTGTIHSKMLLVDSKFAVLGSHNFDARSDYFNLEFCIKVDSCELTQHLEARLEKRRLMSCRVTRVMPDQNQSLNERLKLRARQLPAFLIRPFL